MFKKKTTRPAQATTAAAANTAATNSDGRQFINELYDLLENDKDPNNVVILELILEQWQLLGDDQMAMGVAEEILKQVPSHTVANSVADRVNPNRKTIFAQKFARAKAGRKTGDRPGSASSLSKASISTTPSKRAKRPIRVGKPLTTESDRRQVEADLEAKFVTLKKRAADVAKDVALLQTKKGALDNAADMAADMNNIRDGYVSQVVMPSLPRPVRQLVRDLQGDRQKCLQIIVDDFTEVARWAIERTTTTTARETESRTKRRSRTSRPGSESEFPYGIQPSPAGTSLPSSQKNATPEVDIIRDRLVRRQTLLDAMLPPTLHGLGYTAMKTVEHQLIHIGKTYANTETMLGDDVADISPANLVVTDDNYAWDMSELSDALAVNNGVMRNPLTKDMFSEQDIHQILNHPLGKRLRPMAVEQSELKSGVRQATITRLAALSQTMLGDQSAQATPTITAIDDFMSYFATLPESEKKALKSLKVPAKDTHTGKAYDSAIYEAIQDAKGNRVCYHKTGDFLGQAAKYLRDST